MFGAFEKRAPGYDICTRQTGQVMRDLYSPDSFYTRLGERVSALFWAERRKTIPCLASPYRPLMGVPPVGIELMVI